MQPGSVFCFLSPAHSVGNNRVQKWSFPSVDNQFIVCETFTYRMGRVTLHTLSRLHFAIPWGKGEGARRRCTCNRYTYAHTRARCWRILPSSGSPGTGRQVGEAKHISRKHKCRSQRTSSSGRSWAKSWTSACMSVGIKFYTLEMQWKVQSYLISKPLKDPLGAVSDVEVRPKLAFWCNAVLFIPTQTHGWCRWWSFPFAEVVDL